MVSLISCCVMSFSSVQSTELHKPSFRVKGPPSENMFQSSPRRRHSADDGDADWQPTSKKSRGKNGKFHSQFYSCDVVIWFCSVCVLIDLLH